MSIKAGSLFSALPNSVSPYLSGIVENHFLGDVSYVDITGQPVFPTVGAITANNVATFRVGVGQTSNQIDAVLCASERPAASNRSQKDKSELFPNPTTDGFTILRNSPTENETLIIHSITGKELLSTNLNETEHSTFVSTMGLLPGIYFVSNYSSGVLLTTRKLTILH